VFRRAGGALSSGVNVKKRIWFRRLGLSFTVSTIAARYRTDTGACICGRRHGRVACAVVPALLACGSANGCAGTLVRQPSGAGFFLSAWLGYSVTGRAHSFDQEVGSVKQEGWIVWSTIWIR